MLDAVHDNGFQSTDACRYERHVLQVCFWNRAFDWGTQVVNGIACGGNLLAEVCAYLGYPP